MFSRDHTWEGNEQKGCLLWVEKEANLTWGSGPGVSLLEPCSGNAHLGCPLQEQHSWGSAPLSGLFPSMSFPGKDAEEASREGNSTARQDTQSGSNWRLSASCTPELISGSNRAAFLLKTRSGKGVFLVRVYFIRFRPALCTKGLAKSRIKQREGKKKEKKAVSRKQEMAGPAFLIEDTPVIGKLLLSFQISLNWVFKLAAPTVAAQLPAFVVLKKLCSQIRENHLT